MRKGLMSRLAGLTLAGSSLVGCGSIIAALGVQKNSIPLVELGRGVTALEAANRSRDNVQQNVYVPEPTQQNIPQPWREQSDPEPYKLIFSCRGAFDINGDGKLDYPSEFRGISTEFTASVPYIEVYAELPFNDGKPYDLRVEMFDSNGPPSSINQGLFQPSKKEITKIGELRKDFYGDAKFIVFVDGKYWSGLSLEKSLFDFSNTRIEGR